MTDSGQQAADAAADGQPFAIEAVTIGKQVLRAGRQAGTAGGAALLLFNGIGGNIEMPVPLARAMPGREIITFDVPGIGRSAMPT